MKQLYIRQIFIKQKSSGSKKLKKNSTLNLSSFRNFDQEEMKKVLLSLAGELNAGWKEHGIVSSSYSYPKSTM